jgi:uncharacterized membrane protein YkoI
MRALGPHFLVAAVAGCGGSPPPASAPPQAQPDVTPAADAHADVAVDDASGGVAFEKKIVDAALGARGDLKMEIRLDADGKVVKQTTYHDDPDAIPEAVHDLAAKEFPGAKAARYETEWYADRGLVYEIEVDTKDKKRCEVAATEDGTKIYTECHVKPKALPPEVSKQVEATIPGGKILEAETKKGPDIDVVTVEVEKDGREYYLRLSPDGTLLEKLLRVPAVVEIPQ